MTPKQAGKLPEYTPNPLFAGLSEYVKNPLNFNEIQRILLDTLAVRHSHSEMINWGNCKTCQDKSKERVALMRKFGFKSPAIYLEWKKIMEIILNNKRVPLQ